MAFIHHVRERRKASTSVNYADVSRPESQVNGLRTDIASRFVVCGALQNDAERMRPFVCGLPYPTKGHVRHLIVLP